MTKFKLTLAALLTAGSAVAQGGMELRATINSNNRDTTVENGFRAVEYVGDSYSSLLSYTTPSSTGTVQIEAFYFGPIKYRTRTDNVNWTPWKEFWTTANFNPANYMGASANVWANDNSGKARFYFATAGSAGSTTYIRGYGERTLEVRNLNDQAVFMIGQNGETGIGVTAPAGYKLAVGGSMIAEKIKVKAVSQWPDYVFHPSYQLPTLAELEHYIRQNSHLPEMPDAQTVAAEGIDVGEMNRKLLQKVEELTLYIIEQHKELQAVKDRLKTLETTR